MLFNNWYDLLRVLVIGVLAYIALMFILRVSGKRTLAKLNAFDLVVTVALGSTLATVLLSKNVAFVEAALAFAVLAILQFVVAWSSLRSRRFEEVAKSSPTILLSDGEFLWTAMRNERVTDDEIRSAVRSSGMGDLADVAAVVLETDGSLSVISRDKAGARTAWPRPREGSRRSVT